MTYTLSDKALLAEQYINYTRKNIFLTGKAGTGKTTFLKHIVSTTHKKCIVTAPTGIAALNAGGVTLHSQFQLPPGGFIPQQGELYINEHLKLETRSSLMRHMRMSDVKRNILREMELLIIDEVSMLRADLLDATLKRQEFSQLRLNCAILRFAALFAPALVFWPVRVTLVTLILLAFNVLQHNRNPTEKIIYSY